MKITLSFLSMMIFVSACNASATKTNEEKIKPAASSAAVAVEPGKKEEDCDDKAKKPIEIKEESISLTGNTGCSLDEAKP